MNFSTNYYTLIRYYVNIRTNKVIHLFDEEIEHCWNRGYPYFHDTIKEEWVLIKKVKADESYWDDMDEGNFDSIIKDGC
jgi:hypothetical protein